jgi:extracellular factor (EF) 3-hydroxypalmitic acid methyl ester biosynthesis protein
MDPFEESFPYLAAADRDLLRARSREETYASGDVIVEDGAPVPALYVVASGTVSVEKMHLGGGISLAELGPGALVGEVSFLDGSPASASVVARTEVTAHVIEGVDELLASNPELAAGVYRSLAVLLAGRLRFGNEDRIVSALQWG